MAALVSLLVADAPALWSRLGFHLAGGLCRVAGTSIHLGSPGRGVVGWEVDGVGNLARLTGLPGDGGSDRPGGGDAPAEHPNGAIAIDHVVVATPDLERTVADFEEAGLSLRRIRDAGTAGRPLVQAFFRLEDTVVEVVGSPEPGGPGPPRFYGLAFTVSDLEATAALLGERLGPVTPAVQPGRRIATLDRSAGSTVPMAFMSPR